MCRLREKQLCTCENWKASWSYTEQSTFIHLIIRSYDHSLLFFLYLFIFFYVVLSFHWLWIMIVLIDHLCINPFFIFCCDCCHNYNVYTLWLYFTVMWFDLLQTFSNEPLGIQTKRARRDATTPQEIKDQYAAKKAEEQKRNIERERGHV